MSSDVRIEKRPRGRPRKTIGADYFTRHTRLDDSGCLLWTRALLTTGYARMSTRAADPLAHRWAYRVFVGDIPFGLEIDHLCFNPACVNPLHLEAVTGKENQRRRSVRQTHCVHGHLYDEANTYYEPSRNIRHCRACGRLRSREFYRAHLASPKKEK